MPFLSCTSATPEDRIEKLTAQRRLFNRLLGILALAFSVTFAYYVEVLAPGSTDRRQILSMMAAMSATLLGLLLAASTFVFQIHVESLQAAGVTKGMKIFWQLTRRLSMGLAFAVVAALFGLLDPSNVYSLYAMILAGIGLICAVLFIWLLISDLWATLRLAQT